LRLRAKASFEVEGSTFLVREDKAAHWHGDVFKEGPKLNRKVEKFLSHRAMELRTLVKPKSPLSSWKEQGYCTEPMICKQLWQISASHLRSKTKEHL